MTDSVSTRIARAGAVAALYFLLTAAFSPISFGAIQFRLSECLCILPLIIPEAAIGLTFGCFFSNMMFSTPIDALFGTIATAVSAFLTVLAGKYIKKRGLAFFLGCLSPAIINGILVPFGILMQTSSGEAYSWQAYFVTAWQIALCEAFSVYVCGGIMFIFIAKYAKKHSRDE